MGGARGSSAAAGLAVALALAVAACSGGGGSGSDGDAKADGQGSGGLRVAVLSSRPEYVSAGDALVAVTVPLGADPTDGSRRPART